MLKLFLSLRLGDFVFGWPFLVVAFLIGLFLGFTVFGVWLLFHRNDSQVSLPADEHLPPANQESGTDGQSNTGDLKPSDFVDIMDDIELGTIVFSSEDIKLYCNKTALNMLGDGINECKNLNEFLSMFGTDNGLLTAYVLGKSLPTAVYSRAGRSFTICIHDMFSNSGGMRIVSLYDITQRENLDKQRTLFVSNVSHELKTPLNTIITYSESLLNWRLKEKTIEEVTGDIQRIYSDGIRMKKLVANLSLLNSLDNKAICPLMTEIDLAHLVKYCCETMQINAKAKDINLDLAVSGTIPLVFAERSSLERIIFNLIENAIKYTPNTGRVSVFLNSLGEEVFLKVIDTGIGIPKESLSLIFNRFYRVDNSGSSVLGGTGLGLSIAKELADLHNGRITVSSASNAGSEFTLYLPVAYKVMEEAIAKRKIGRFGVQLPIIFKLAQDFICEQMGVPNDPSSLAEISDKDTEEFLRQYKIESGGDGVSTAVAKVVPQTDSTIVSDSTRTEGEHNIDSTETRQIELSEIKPSNRGSKDEKCETPSNAETSTSYENESKDLPNSALGSGGKGADDTMVFGVTPVKNHKSDSVNSSGSGSAKVGKVAKVEKVAKISTVSADSTVDKEYRQSSEKSSFHVVGKSAKADKHKHDGEANADCHESEMNHDL